MSLRERIERARRAQIEHDKRVPVQLEIQEQETLWASEEEMIQRFRDEYLSETELQMLRTDMAAHPQDY